MSRKNKFAKLILGILTVTILFTLSSVSVEAAKFNADAFSRSKNPRASQLVFFNGADGGNHFNAFNYGRDKMHSTSSNININRTTDRHSANIIASSSNAQDTWFGLIRYVGNSDSNIMLHRTNTTNAGFTTANYRKTAMHEFGHALGLDHQDSPTVSVMRSGKLTYSDYSTLDKSNLTWRYGR